uniref:Uncharacterized protein n=1 Tax=Romanomermis culicivorax TaxID=13658 RepID=A0A915K4J6_ROMCU
MQISFCESEPGRTTASFGERESRRAPLGESEPRRRRAAASFGESELPRDAPPSPFFVVNFVGNSSVRIGVVRRIQIVFERLVWPLKAVFIVVVVFDILQ